jgi:phosphatidylserine decarboxylase
MLDSLGSTLTRSTVDSFFTRNGKKPHADDLTLAEAIQCLETELGRPNSEKRRVDTDDSPPGTGAPVTPLLQYDPSDAESPPAFEKLDFSGQKMRPAESAHHNAEKPAAPAGFATESNEVPLIDVANGTGTGSPTVTLSGRMERSASGTSSDAEESGGSNADDSFERVINVKNCPLCHRPRLNAKAEVDIVTHLAVCASQDWEKVDRIVVGNYVTASQAQRKWYTRIISKVSSGDYRLGANSANIIVQNRMTGQLEEEKMQVYVRLGIRLLYKGAKSRMEGARARKLLKSLSIKQGIKYDSPESVRDIPTFIEFHNLPVDEILDPLDSFKTFNEFFYRKLKPSARPVESPDDPYRLVSGADCRLMSFESVNEATRLWIKGREFTVARLLGDAYRAEAERYTGGALAIFRLAPQDYHRFHSPVNGTIGPITSISGEYYTVNPQAIRTALDVYGENVRNIVPIDSPQFGRVMAVCIGAMMVGSIKMTVQEGDRVARGQEFGYFAFGGSTIVLLFERGVVEWDEDLLINGRASLETLVRVGMGIGRGTRR